MPSGSKGGSLRSRWTDTSQILSTLGTTRQTPLSRWDPATWRCSESPCTAIAKSSCWLSTSSSRVLCRLSRHRRPISASLSLKSRAWSFCQTRFPQPRSRNKKVCRLLHRQPPAQPLGRNGSLLLHSRLRSCPLRWLQSLRRQAFLLLLPLPRPLLPVGHKYRRPRAAKSSPRATTSLPTCWIKLTTRRLPQSPVWPRTRQPHLRLQATSRRLQSLVSPSLPLRPLRPPRQLLFLLPSWSLCLRQLPRPSRDLLLLLLSRPGRSLPCLLPSLPLRVHLPLHSRLPPLQLPRSLRRNNTVPPARRQNPRRWLPPSQHPRPHQSLL